jgi:hypothetical protein
MAAPVRVLLRSSRQEYTFTSSTLFSRTSKQFTAGYKNTPRCPSTQALSTTGLMQPQRVTRIPPSEQRCYSTQKAKSKYEEPEIPKTDFKAIFHNAHPAVKGVVIVMLVIMATAETYTYSIWIWRKLYPKEDTPEGSEG